jgi:hypothetical protein
MISHVLHAQIPDTLWTRIYGRSGPDHAYATVQTVDNCYITAGMTFTANPICNYDVYLLKINNAGDTAWTKVIGRTYNDCAYSITTCFDGGYILTGYSETGSGGNEDVYLVKTDSSGDTMWTRTYGGSDDERGYCVTQTLDNGYIIVGDITENYREDILLIKTNAMGDTLWTKRYGTQYEDFGRCVLPTADSGYIVLGHTDVEYGCQCFAVWLLRMNQYGDTIWTRTYDRESYDDRSYELKQTSDGGYIIIGTALVSGNLWDMLVIKTDAYGDTLWKETYGGSYYDYGYSVTETYDGGYIIAGSTKPSSTADYDVHVRKLDHTGSTLWTKTYGGIENDEGLSVLQNADLNYLVTGYSESFGATNADAYLIMLGPDSFGIHDAHMTASLYGMSVLSAKPNPSMHSFQITVTHAEPDAHAHPLCIYDITGHLVRQVDFISSMPNRFHTVWDGHNQQGTKVPAGVYIAVYQDRHEQITEKLILIR